MDMQVNFELVKELRLERGWSQEQLAEIAGVSLRTIQRVEADGNCSLETRNALAAAFDTTGANLEHGAVGPAERKKVKRGLLYGTIGVVGGVLLGLLGLALDLLEGGTGYELVFGISGGVMGLVFGLWGAFVGRVRDKYRLG